jgi:eukaryotic-like serine/threonine-protein kinase
MIGQTLATYRLVEKLGEGGMGEVYRALDEMLDRDVALKMLKPELARRQATVDRFRAEAITLAKLDHPGIARIYGCSVHDDRWFIVMEFVRGETLLGRLARYGRLPWIEVVPIVCQLLDALEYAHRRGVIHRDMKPANVLMSNEGAVKVTDFGIARVLGTERATRTGHIVGTLEYMSPEQVRGEEVDGRADLYAVGILLFELLTGRVPFRGGAEYEVLTQHLQAPIPSVRHVVPELPAWFDDVLQRALAKSPADRYPSAAAFQVALEGYASAEPAMRIKATRLANAVMDAAVIGTTGALPRATDPQAVFPTLPGPQTAPTILNPRAPDTGGAPTRLAADLVPTRLASSGVVAAAGAAGAVGPPPPPPPAPPSPALSSPALPPALPPPALPRLGPPSVDTAPTRRTRGQGITWRQLTAAGAIAAVLVVAVVVGISRFLRKDPVVVTPAGGGVADAPRPVPRPEAEIAVAGPPPEAPRPTEVAPSPEPAPPVVPIERAPGTGTPAPARPAPGTTAPPVATPPTAEAPGATAPTPPPAPTSAPAPAAASAAPHAEAAAIEFEEVALVTLVGDDVEEREIVLRFESDRVVLVDADSETAVRTIPYRSITDATYARTRRPVLKADRDRAGLVRGVAKGGGLFRRTPHWLTLEGAVAPILLKVDGDDIDRVLSQIESRTPARVERVSEK